MKFAGLPVCDSSCSSTLGPICLPNEDCCCVPPSLPPFFSHKNQSKIALGDAKKRETFIQEGRKEKKGSFFLLLSLSFLLSNLQWCLSLSLTDRRVPFCVLRWEITTHRWRAKKRTFTVFVTLRQTLLYSTYRDTFAHLFVKWHFEHFK